MDDYVNYVDKESKPPVESFWKHFPQKIYEGGWQASTEQVLIDRIKLKVKEIDLNFLQSLMNSKKNQSKIEIYCR